MRKHKIPGSAPSVRVIAIMIEARDPIFRSILEGIRAFAQTRPDWVFEVLAMESRPMSMFETFNVAGVIGCFDRSDWVRSLRRSGRPLVCITQGCVDAPAVGLDEKANARLAAGHFLERGLRHFAFLSTRDDRLTEIRLRGFRERLLDEGRDCSVLVLSQDPKGDWPGTSAAMQRRIRQWVSTLPMPVGLLATKDVGGLEAVHACREAGLRVPEDVSIVGLQHDDILCQFANPSVSTVRSAVHRLGYEAAAMLDRLLEGQPVAHRHVLLPPEGLTLRQSSDFFAVQDALLGRALKYIAEHAHQRLRVSDVLREVPLSRRALEQKFKAAIGRTPGREIRRVRLERAKDLLRQTDLPIGEVADRAGFSEIARLDQAFRRDLGLTPRRFRQQSRLGAAAPGGHGSARFEPAAAGGVR